MIPGCDSNAVNIVLKPKRTFRISCISRYLVTNKEIYCRPMSGSIHSEDWVALGWRLSFGALAAARILFFLGGGLGATNPATHPIDVWSCFTDRKQLERVSKLWPQSSSDSALVLRKCGHVICPVCGSASTTWPLEMKSIHSSKRRETLIQWHYVTFQKAWMLSATVETAYAVEFWEPGLT